MYQCCRITETLSRATNARDSTAYCAKVTTDSSNADPPHSSEISKTRLNAIDLALSEMSIGRFEITEEFCMDILLDRGLDRSTLNNFLTDQSIFLGKLRSLFVFYHDNLHANCPLTEFPMFQPTFMTFVQEFMASFEELFPTSSPCFVKPAQASTLQGEFHFKAKGTQRMAFQSISGHGDLLAGCSQVATSSERALLDLENVTCVLELKSPYGKLHHSACAASKDQFILETECLFRTLLDKESTMSCLDDSEACVDAVRAAAVEHPVTGATTRSAARAHRAAAAALLLADEAMKATSTASKGKVMPTCHSLSKSDHSHRSGSAVCATYSSVAKCPGVSGKVVGDQLSARLRKPSGGTRANTATTAAVPTPAIIDLSSHSVGLDLTKYPTLLSGILTDSFVICANYRLPTRTGSVHLHTQRVVEEKLYLLMLLLSLLPLQTSELVARLTALGIEVAVDPLADEDGNDAEMDQASPPPADPDPSTGPVTRSSGRGTGAGMKSSGKRQGRRERGTVADKENDMAIGNNVDRAALTTVLKVKAAPTTVLTAKAAPTTVLKVKALPQRTFKPIEDDDDDDDMDREEKIEFIQSCRRAKFGPDVITEERLRQWNSLSSQSVKLR